MMASLVALGTPFVQLEALFQLVFDRPFQLVDCAMAKLLINSSTIIENNLPTDSDKSFFIVKIL